MIDYDSILKAKFDSTKDIKKEKFYLDDYEITYYRQRNNSDFVIFDNEDNKLIHFQSTEELKQFLLDRVINGNNSYPEVFYKGSNLLKDFTDNIAFHTSSVENRSKILSNGLIPNGTSNLSVLSANIFADLHRTRSIPKNFYKSLSVYLYPDYFLSSTEETLPTDEDLYAVDISGLNWRIGSIFLSGNILNNCSYFDELEQPEHFISDKSKITTVQKYWKNSYSKEEYLNKSDRVMKSKNSWDLDELLYCGIIDKSRINLIATWNRNKLLWCFNEDIIKSFIKEEYLNNYRDILKRINRNQESI